MGEVLEEQLTHLSSLANTKHQQQAFAQKYKE
jgi:hypothetical protein